MMARFKLATIVSYKIPGRVRRTNLTCESFPFMLAWNKLGYRHEHLQSLCTALDIPAWFKLDNAGKVAGEEAFLFLLCRFKTPATLIDFDQVWVGTSGKAGIEAAATEWSGVVEGYRGRD